jgi:Fis family transcriptional regulator
MRKGPARSRKITGAKAAAAHAVVANAACTFADFDDRPLHRCVENALNAYFDALDGENTCGLFDLVMAEVERPMLDCVMRYVGGNQSRAAGVLGLSRGTLRKKLSQYGLLDD